MATYSANLGLTLPADGEFAGTWGQITNTNLGTLLEQAVSGYTTQAVTAGVNTTITIDNGSGTGLNNTGRYMYLELTGTGGAGTNLIVPNNRKLYFIYNNTSGTPGQVTVKTAAGSGISVAAGNKMLLVCNGTSVVDAVNFFNFSTVSAVSVSASTTITAGTTITATGSVTGSALIPSAATIPSNGVYLPSANYLGFASNTTARGGIDANGAWIFNAPSSGAHIVNILAGSNGVTFSTAAHSFILYSDNSTYFGLGTTTTIPVRFLCNNVVVGTIATTGGWSVSAPTSGVALTINGVAGTHSTQIADNNNVKFDAGYLGIPQNAQTAAYAMTHQDRGKHISITTGGVTINASAYLVGITGTTAYWSAGDSFVIYNNSGSNQNITAGAGVSFRLAGTATAGSPRILAQYGVATCLCVTGGATPTFVISGSGVT